jgi:hypothetical protein
MANRAGRLAVLVAAGAMLAAPRDATAQTATGHVSHVRSHSAAVLAIIQLASERSETFRALVTSIDAGKGIVYVEEGRCKLNLRACLVMVTPARDGYRMLTVRVDTAKPDWDLAGSLGHELYHVTEVLSDPDVTTAARMYSMYTRIGKLTSGVFETNGAVAAGEAVRKEFAKSMGPVPRPK